MSTKLLEKLLTKFINKSEKIIINTLEDVNDQFINKKFKINNHTNFGHVYRVVVLDKYSICDHRSSDDFWYDCNVKIIYFVNIGSNIYKIKNNKIYKDFTFENGFYYRNPTFLHEVDSKLSDIVETFAEKFFKESYIVVNITETLEVDKLPDIIEL